MQEEAAEGEGDDTEPDAEEEEEEAEEEEDAEEEEVEVNGGLIPKKANCKIRRMCVSAMDGNIGLAAVCRLPPNTRIKYRSRDGGQCSSLHNRFESSTKSLNCSTTSVAVIFR